MKRLITLALLCSLSSACFAQGQLEKLFKKVKNGKHELVYLNIDKDDKHVYLNEFIVKANSLDKDIMKAFEEDKKNAYKYVKHDGLNYNSVRLSYGVPKKTKIINFYGDHKMVYACFDADKGNRTAYIVEWRENSEIRFARFYGEKPSSTNAQTSYDYNSTIQSVRQFGDSVGRFANDAHAVYNNDYKESTIDEFTSLFVSYDVLKNSSEATRGSVIKRIYNLCKTKGSELTKEEAKAVTIGVEDIRKSIAPDTYYHALLKAAIEFLKK